MASSPSPKRGLSLTKQLNQYHAIITQTTHICIHNHRNTHNNATYPLRFMYITYFKRPLSVCFRLSRAGTLSSPTIPLFAPVLLIGPSSLTLLLVLVLPLGTAVSRLMTGGGTGDVMDACFPLLSLSIVVSQVLSSPVSAKTNLLLGRLFSILLDTEIRTKALNSSNSTTTEFSPVHSMSLNGFRISSGLLHRLRLNECVVNLHSFIANLQFEL